CGRRGINSCNCPVVGLRDQTTCSFSVAPRCTLSRGSIFPDCDFHFVHPVFDSGERPNNDAPKLIRILRTAPFLKTRLCCLRTKPRRRSVGFFWCAKPLHLT